MAEDFGLGDCFLDEVGSERGAGSSSGVGSKGGGGCGWVGWLGEGGEFVVGAREGLGCGSNEGSTVLVEGFYKLRDLLISSVMI